jgi:hypothetical protein
MPILYADMAVFWHSCSFIGIAAYYSTNLTLAWRLPLALACVGPVALLAGIIVSAVLAHSALVEMPSHFVWSMLIEAKFSMFLRRLDTWFG